MTKTRRVPQPKKITRLPTKLSDCLVLALADLKKVEASPQYRVNMNGVWHSPVNAMRWDRQREAYVTSGKSKCAVCFAGAVMACSLGTDLFEDAEPDSFSTHNQQRLEALNKLREGKVDEALDEVGQQSPYFSDYANTALNVTPYETNRVKWRQDMGVILGVLRAIGR